MAAGSGRVSVDDRRRQGCGGAGVALYVGRVSVRVSVQDLRSHVRAGDTMGSVYRCDMRSVQQQRGTQRRRKCPEGHAISAKGATSISDAWGVRPKAAPGGPERPILLHPRSGNRRRRSRRRGAATAIEWRTVRREPQAVVRSTLPEA